MVQPAAEEELVCGHVDGWMACQQARESCCARLVPWRANFSARSLRRTRTKPDPFAPVNRALENVQTRLRGHQAKQRGPGRGLAQRHLLAKHYVRSPDTSILSALIALSTPPM